MKWLIDKIRALFFLCCCISLAGAAVVIVFHALAFAWPLVLFFAGWILFAGRF